MFQLSAIDHAGSGSSGQFGHAHRPVARRRPAAGAGRARRGAGDLGGLGPEPGGHHLPRGGPAGLPRPLAARDVHHDHPGRGLDLGLHAVHDLRRAAGRHRERDQLRPRAGRRGRGPAGPGLRPQGRAGGADHGREQEPQPRPAVVLEVLDPGRARRGGPLQPAAGQRHLDRRAGRRALPGRPRLRQHRGRPPALGAAAGGDHDGQRQRPRGLVRQRPLRVHVRRRQRLGARRGPTTRGRAPAGSRARSSRPGAGRSRAAPAPASPTPPSG